MLFLLLEILLCIPTFAYGMQSKLDHGSGAGHIYYVMTALSLDPKRSFKQDSELLFMISFKRNTEHMKTPLTKNKVMFSCNYKTVKDQT